MILELYNGLIFVVNIIKSYKEESVFRKIIQIIITQVDFLPSYAVRILHIFPKSYFCTQKGQADTLPIRKHICYYY